MSFPVITIGDMVRLQKMLIDSSGHRAPARRLRRIDGRHAGARMGRRVSRIAWSPPSRSPPPRATARSRSPSTKWAGRRSWRIPIGTKATITASSRPARGLAVARMVGHITYMSDDSMREKFGRRLRGKENFSFGFDVDFEVESYLRYRGSQFVDRFDANSYLYITKAMDYFDLTNGHGSLAAAFEKAQARFLVISFSSDWLYPSYQSQEIVRALRAPQRDVAYCELQSNYGHDAFLVDVAEQTELVRGFLASTFEKAAMTASAAAGLRPRTAGPQRLRHHRRNGRARAPRCSIWAAAKASCWRGWPRTRAWMRAAWRSPAPRCSGPSPAAFRSIQGDIDEGLADYPDQAFDYVILSQTLQETRHPLQGAARDAARRPARHRRVPEFRPLDGAAVACCSADARRRPSCFRTIGTIRRTSTS